MNKKGFTLLEMLSVLVLICILALLVFPSLINFIKKQQNIVENVNMSLIEEIILSEVISSKIRNLSLEFSFELAFLKLNSKFL